MGGNKPHVSAPVSRYAALRNYNEYPSEPVREKSMKQLPRPSGYLSDFYTHPDSYLVLPSSGAVGHNLSTRSKVRFAAVRWTEVSLRSLHMLGAAGLLFCAVVLQNLLTYEQWILRIIEPGVDILATTYALLRLNRRTGDKAPKRLAGFHVLASCMDASFVALYVYIAVFTEPEFVNALKSETSWTTMFGSVQASNTISLSAWVISLSLGISHAITMATSTYLVVKYSQLAKLPPNTDPLDDALTTRYSGSTFANSPGVYSKELSTETGQSVNTLTEEIPQLPVLSFQREENKEKSLVYTQPWQTPSCLPQSPAATKVVRPDLSSPNIYQEPIFARPTSRLDTSNADDYERNRMVSSSSVYSSRLPTMTNMSIRSLPTLPRRSSKRETLLSDNWYVLAAAKDEEYSVIPEESEYFNPYGPLVKLNASASRFSFAANEVESPGHTPGDGFTRQPLGMNPPTPPEGSIINQAKPLPDLLIQASELDSISSPVSKYATPSKKHYGDLKSAYEAIQNARSSPGKVSTPRSAQADRSGRVISSSGADIGDLTIPYPEFEGVQHSASGSHTEHAWMADTRLKYGGLRGRNVSGKMAEEGMSGGWI